ncbi:MAG: hypothetical protein AAF533_01130 [Acidobacteriota bacterium]
MKENDLMRELARLASDQSASGPIDSRFEKLAAGELDEPELAALRREAEGDARLAAALEALQPRGESRRRELLGRARAALRESAEGEESLPLEDDLSGDSDDRSDDADDLSDHVEDVSAPDSVVPLVPPSSRARRLPWIGSGLAAALLVAVVGYQAWQDSRTPGSMPSLRGHQLLLNTGELARRGSEQPADLLVHRTDGQLELVIMPPDEAPGSTVTFYLRTDAGLRQWDVTPQRAASGAVKLKGGVSELGLTEGPLDIVAVVALPGAEPSSPELDEVTARTRPGSVHEGDGWLLLRGPPARVEPPIR